MYSEYHRRMTIGQRQWTCVMRQTVRLVVREVKVIFALSHITGKRSISEFLEALIDLSWMNST